MSLNCFTQSIQNQVSELYEKENQMKGKEVTINISLRTALRSRELLTDNASILNELTSTLEAEKYVGKNYKETK